MTTIRYHSCNIIMVHGGASDSGQLVDLLFLPCGCLGVPETTLECLRVSGTPTIGRQQIGAEACPRHCCRLQVRGVGHSRKIHAKRATRGRVGHGVFCTYYFQPSPAGHKVGCWPPCSKRVTVSQVTPKSVSQVRPEGCGQTNTTKKGRLFFETSHRRPVPGHPCLLIKPVPNNLTYSLSVGP